LTPCAASSMTINWFAAAMASSGAMAHDMPA
jgi:hypothetical protein